MGRYTGIYGMRFLGTMSRTIPQSLPCESVKLSSEPTPRREGHSNDDTVHIAVARGRGPRVRHGLCQIRLDPHGAERLLLPPVPDLRRSDESIIAQIVEHLGADYFIWASDYPHIDASTSYALAGKRWDRTRSASIGWPADGKPRAR